MNKRYNSLSIIGRIYVQTLKTIPISGVLSPLYYLIEGIFPAFVTLISTKLFDSVYLFVNGSDSLNSLYFNALLLLVGYAIKLLLQYISSITINAGVYERCTSASGIRIADKAARLPLISYENAEIINSQNRAQDCVNREILSQIYMTTVVFITSGLSIIAIAMVLASYNIWFLPISLFSVFPYLVANLIRGKEFYYVKRQQAKKSRRRDYLWTLLTEKQSIKEMRVMGFGPYITERWIECRDEVNEELWEQSKKDAFSLLLCDIIRITGYGFSIILSLYLTLNGHITIGVFGASISAFLSVQEATKSFLNELGRMPEKISYAKDYFEYLDLPEETEGNIQFNGIADSIDMKDINFKYPNCATYAVKNASFKIKKGEKIAILGENGSGKTTISKLILGLYPIESGEVSYDGKRVSDFSKASLYKKVSAIAQDFVCYLLSLRENVAIADINQIKNDNRIESTLQNAGLAELNNSNDGLETQLGREFGGIELSGGQWQKLAIARGMFKDSDLILLDEPTSALDPLIESEILSNFLKIAKDKTAIIISHRVGLCTLVDKIVVMKAGEICEMGSHTELMKNKKEYYRLYNSQRQWYL